MARRGRGAHLGIDQPLEHLRRRLISWARLHGAVDVDNVSGEVIKRALADPGAGPALRAYLDEPSSPAPDADWPLGRLMAWLHTAVKFVVSEERRTVDARLVVPTTDDRPFEAMDRDAGALARLIEAQSHARVHACLATLRPDHARAVRLWAHGFTHADIAARLDATTTAVNNWIARGLRTVKACVHRSAPPRDGSR